MAEQKRVVLAIYDIAADGSGRMAQWFVSAEAAQQIRGQLPAPHIETLHSDTQGIALAEVAQRHVVVLD
jgi:hypothetical protein